MRTRRSQFSGNQMQSDPEVKPREVEHLPVLLHEVIEGLAIQPTDVVVDATLGGAGHSLRIASLLGAEGLLIGIDADHDAIHRTARALSEVAPKRILIEGNFRDIDKHLSSRGIESVDKALFDLGWSSYQLYAGRGFSIKSDEPLLMTFSKEPGADDLTAATILNSWQEESIADVIYGWGEERYARRIARAIVERRAKKPYTTAGELVETIVNCVPPVYRRGKIHAATRTFQALRITVNDELGALMEGVRAAWKYLAPGGRIAVISFHSIEDRIVKQLFRGWETREEGIRITRKPIVAGTVELSLNPRARSAKLRIVQKK